MKRPTVLRDSFASHPRSAAWEEGSRHGPWVVDFTGFGSVAPRGSNAALRLAPQPATRADETHASLVHTAAVQRNFDAAVTTSTIRQLRTGSTPNAWERAWTLWHYTDPTHFYYVVLKDNGWEIGKADPAYPGAQRFLVTGSSPTYALGTKHKVEISQRGATFTVKAAGRVLATFTDTERPYLSGSVGLYTEDADVAFDDVVVRNR